MGSPARAYEAPSHYCVGVFFMVYKLGGILGKLGGILGKILCIVRLDAGGFPSNSLNSINSNFQPKIAIAKG